MHVIGFLGVLFGAFDAGSASQLVFTAPEIAWEPALPIHVLRKGFKTTGAITLDNSTPTVAPKPDLLRILLSRARLARSSNSAVLLAHTGATADKDACGVASTSRIEHRGRDGPSRNLAHVAPTHTKPGHLTGASGPL